MKTEVNENALIASLAASLPRSPLQLNNLQESDAEFITLPGSIILALTTDTIAEEIASGLYADPWLAGWMAVMANFSDLAAVGADPLGILLAETIPPLFPVEARMKLQKGIREACVACASYVLGGDTNAGDALQITGTAVGCITDGRPLTRIGIHPGDLLFTTGRLGIGNAFAAVGLMGDRSTLPDYRPSARLRQGRRLRSLAAACMDTSDGALATLDQLARLNGVGFTLASNWEDLLDPACRELAPALGIPPWVFLAGPHGEFELFFTLPAGTPHDRLDELSSQIEGCAFVGRATEVAGIHLPGIGRFSPDDLALIRNLETPRRGEVSRYLQNLLEIGHRAEVGHRIDKSMTDTGPCSSILHTDEQAKG
jgi:thiamine-monophosphate kinase